MVNIKNNTDNRVKAGLGLVIEANQIREVSEATLNRLRSENYFRVQERLGNLTVEKESPVTAQPTLTRSWVAAATKKDLEEVLAAHGVDEELYSGRLNSDLREMVSRVVFVEL